MSKRQLKLFGSQMEIYTHLEKMFHPEAGLNTVLLTGKSGAGKSTVVQEFLREFGVSIHGYTTVRHRSVSRQEVAFQHIYLPESATPPALTIEYPNHLPDLEYFLRRVKDRVVFDRAAFLKLADYMSPQQVFRNKTPELMLWDELGGEELLIDHLFETVKYWLDLNEKPAQIIVWKKQFRRSKLRLAHLTAEEEDILELRRQEILSHPSIHIHDLDCEEVEI